MVDSTFDANYIILNIRVKKRAQCDEAMTSLIDTKVCSIFWLSVG